MARTRDAWLPPAQATSPMAPVRSSYKPHGSLPSRPLNPTPEPLNQSRLLQLTIAGGPSSVRKCDARRRQPVFLCRRCRRSGGGDCRGRRGRWRRRVWQPVCAATERAADQRHVTPEAW
eukprot:364515-Chlamydomonas_euryale.AAC.10